MTNDEEVFIALKDYLQFVRLVYVAKQKIPLFFNAKYLFSLLSIIEPRARGYPEPVVTWRREDGTEIVLKDSMGTKTHGKLENFS